MFTISRVTPLLITAALLATQSAYAEMIGKVARQQGHAFISVNGKTLPLSKGAEIMEESVVITGRDSRLQIDFIDQSQMILGEDAAVSLEELNLDPPWWSFKKLSQKISVFQGTFRFITGKVAKSNRQAFNFSTPVATMGVRGTDFFGGPLEAGMPPGQIHYGFMIIDGAISVDNTYGSSVLDETYEGTFLPMNGSKAPTATNVWSDQAISEAFASIQFEE